MKFIILCFIFLFFAVSSASAVNFGTMPSTGEYGITGAPTVSDASTVAGYIQNVVKWAYTIFFIVAILFVLFSAYGYLAGAGNPETISKAHKQLMYAAIAVIVALLAVSFNTIVLNLMSGGGGGGSYSGSGSSSGNNQTSSYGIDRSCGTDNDYGDNSCTFRNSFGQTCDFDDGYLWNSIECQ